MALTKKARVKAHLEIWGSITPLEALHEYGSFRLSAIIYVLKREGMMVDTEMVSERGSTFAKYWLRKKPQRELDFS